MTTMLKLFRCPLLLLVAALVLGCRDRGITLPTAPVVGKVIYNSKPLGFGKIIFFHPSGHASGADIAADGTFSLTVYQGANRVAIECFDTDKPGSTKTRSRMMADNKSLIPDRYMSYGSSGLGFEVKPGTDNEVEFTLED